MLPCQFRVFTRINLVPEYAFVFGAVMLGCISIGAGFVRDKIVLIVLRALSGIGTSPVFSCQKM